jgi:hypothetical protein
MKNHPGTRKRHRDGLSRRVRLALALPALLLAAGTVGAQSVGDCLAVEVPQPMVLPDGSSHPAGSLRICLSAAFSPVEGLHEIRVDGAPLGLHRSRRARGEGQPGPYPWVLFEKNRRDELVLVAYGWPENGRMNTFRLSDGVRQPEIASRTEGHSAPVAEDSTVSTVLLVARTN